MKPGEHIVYDNDADLSCYGITKNKPMKIVSVGNKRISFLNNKGLILKVELSDGSFCLWEKDKAKHWNPMVVKNKKEK